MHRHRHCSGLLSFSSLSLRPQYPRLVFPPTLPIILDVITHHNVTHKGKRLLRLETDPSRTLWSNSHRISTDGPVFACSGFAENTHPPWNKSSILPNWRNQTFFLLPEMKWDAPCIQTKTIHYQDKRRFTMALENAFLRVSVWKWRYWAKRWTQLSQPALACLPVHEGENTMILPLRCLRLIIKEAIFMQSQLRSW